MNAGLAMLALDLLCLPPLLVHTLHRQPMFDVGYNEPASDQRIAGLLVGEWLAPPPTLPPDIFATRELEAIRPAIMRANRDWDLLDVDFRQRLLAVFELMRERHGYETVLIEGYRSPERQTMLASLRARLTRATANTSYHQFGLAADCAFLLEGRLVISEQDPWAMRGYELLGQIAETSGLHWGGRWTLRDFGHVELRHAGKPGRPQS